MRARVHVGVLCDCLLCILSLNIEQKKVKFNPMYYRLGIGSAAARAKTQVLRRAAAAAEGVAGNRSHEHRCRLAVYVFSSSSLGSCLLHVFVYAHVFSCAVFSVTKIYCCM